MKFTSFAPFFWLMCAQYRVQRCCHLLLVRAMVWHICGAAVVPSWANCQGTRIGLDE